MNTKNTYAEKLKDPRWQKKRLEVLSRSDFSCELCGDKELELHVHHLSYKSSGNPWDSDLDDLQCLCRECHFVVEDLKSTRQFDIHEIRKSEYIAVVGIEDFEATVVIYRRQEFGDPIFLLPITLSYMDAAVPHLKSLVARLKMYDEKVH